MGIELSVVLLAVDADHDLGAPLALIRSALGPLGVAAETIVVRPRDGGGAPAGTRVVRADGRGYAAALRAAFAAARGAFVMTVDADLSHDPQVIARLWAARDPGGITVASRYVSGGRARMDPARLAASRLLNAVFSRGLSVKVRDVSSAFRIYPAAALERLRVTGSDYDALPELLVRAHADGWRIREIPFDYAPGDARAARRRSVRLAWSYLRTFMRLYVMRNSTLAADYDERAFDSPIWLQRAWQRRRHEIVTRETPRAGRIVDIGCGSSRILRDLPGALGIDVSHPKLRYMSRYGLPLVQASVFALPLADDSVDVIVCSEVIEHVPAGNGPFEEMARVQRRGGTLVLGTPDYATRSWRIFEALYRRLAPGGYADEHITQYSHASLVRVVSAHGYRYLRTDRVFGSEMILTFERV